MEQFPQHPPEIAFRPLHSSVPARECPILRWWFIQPSEGDACRWATYEAPHWELAAVEEMIAAGRGRVHDEEAMEFRYRKYWPNNDLEREAFADISGNEKESRWLGWWNLSDDLKFYTSRDPNFSHDWGACPARIVDNGQFVWQNPMSVTMRPRTGDELGDPIAAGE